MNSTKNVVANFAVLNPSIQASVTAKVNGPLAQERDYTLALKNAGTGMGTACKVTALSTVNMVGGGRVTLLTALPVVYGNVGAGGQVAKVIRITVPTTVQRFNLTATGNCLNALGQTVSFTTTTSVTR
jgi:hypothetical protein